MTDHWWYCDHHINEKCAQIQMWAYICMEWIEASNRPFKSHLSVWIKIKSFSEDLFDMIQCWSNSGCSYMEVLWRPIKENQWLQEAYFSYCLRARWQLTPALQRWIHRQSNIYSLLCLPSPLYYYLFFNRIVCMCP